MRTTTATTTCLSPRTSSGWAASATSARTTTGDFASYDADDDGFLNQQEFGQFYGTDYTARYDELDTDDDEMLTETEYTTGLYDSADLDDDQVVTIEEEGFFEGWFDGDDVEAELRDVGQVY